MINEVLISRLNNLIGEYNTPFFKYLLYSYDMSLNDCEIIINEIKEDINDNKITNDNLITIIDEYFKKNIEALQKKSKINYLDDLINGDFFDKYLKKYDLTQNEIDVIYEKVRIKISNDNIDEFEIKRLLRYYFLNSIKQQSYFRELNFIVGRNYDTLNIVNAKKKYPILVHSDIVEIIDFIRSDIVGAVEFKNGIKKEFFKRCMMKSEAKKAEARHNLNEFVEGCGDSFLKFLNFKNLSKKEGELIISDIQSQINNGLIQPDKLNGAFLTEKFNEYIENEG